MGIMDPISNATHSAIEWAGTKNGILFRIELLVTISVIILTTLVFLGSLRRRSGNPFLKFVLWGSCTISHTVASYTIGLMQSTPFRNELFVIWSTFLLIVLGNADSITAYSLEDNEQQTRTTLNQVLQIMFVVTLEERYYAGLGSDFRWLFIALFMLSFVKMGVRVDSYQLASRSRGLIGANKLVADYMTYEHELSPPQEVNPGTMSGYKYLITGEERQDLRPTAPHYVKRLQMNDCIITLDKVWQCKGEVLSSSGDRDMRRKDLLLSYALFKLLRRRYGGYPLAECRLQKTRDLVLQGLLSDVERAFRVIEVELAFLYDFFYTKYPSIFSPAESSSTDILLLVFLLLVVTVWATWSTLLHYKSPEGDENLIVRGFRIDVGLTNTLLFLVMAMESFQLVAVAISDWSKVRLLCTYMRRPSWQKNVYVNRGLKQLCKLRLVDTWGKKMSKCLLLQDYGYRPTVARLTRGKLDKTREGQKVNSTVALSEEVKKAVAEALRRSNGLLTGGRASLRRNGVEERLSWACPLEMHAQTILVWHIATTLCEIEPVRDAAGRTSSRPPQAAEDMKVATDLSGYCAYLVAFVPALLPDHSFNTELIFDSVIREARSYLKGCESMRSRFLKMMNLGDEEPADSILKMGARLGREIMDNTPDRTQRWKLLAEFWAELLLFLAPSDNINAHAEMLTSGGEFITHLWALLTHAGIVERPPAAEDTS